jgi:hypothetical protein
MFDLWTKTPQKVAIAAQPAVDYEAIAHERVRELKTKLDELDREMLHFKTKNRIRTDKFGRLLGVECAEITGYGAVSTQWRILLKRRDGLVTQWHEALKTWCETKETA